MKLFSVNGKIHITSKMGVRIRGIRIATSACNPRHYQYANGEVGYEFDGEPSQVTCKKCMQKAHPCEKAK